MTTQAPPSPELFFETLWAHQRTAVLKAAIELDVFGAMHAGSHTVPEIAERCQSSQRGIRVLCDYLAMLGFLTKDGGKYALTPDSAVFLVRQSPAFLGGTLEFMLSDGIVRNHEYLADTIRSGRLAPQANDTVSHENPVWEKFARAMAPMMVMPAQAIAEILGVASAGPIRVLDIAAGHGVFGITIAQRNAQAQVTAVDWPRVLTVASDNARAAGVSDRHHTLPGDAFVVDWGAGFDVALVTNFLHHFDIPTCTSFLSKVRGSLADGGRVAILEFVPNEDRISPPLAASFAMTMLAGTQSGSAYTMPELTAMLQDAGFRDMTRHMLPGPQSWIVAVK